MCPCIFLHHYTFFVYIVFINHKRHKIKDTKAIGRSHAADLQPAGLFFPPGCVVLFGMARQNARTAAHRAGQINLVIPGLQCLLGLFRLLPIIKHTKHRRAGTSHQAGYCALGIQLLTDSGCFHRAAAMFQRIACSGAHSSQIVFADGLFLALTVRVNRASDIPENIKEHMIS